MKAVFSKILSYIFAMSTCLMILCFVIETVSFDVKLHSEKVDKQSVAALLDIDDAQIDDALNKVVKFIKGESDNMQIELSGGRYLFNERELAHMDDVQTLFALCSAIRTGCIGVCMISFILLFALNGFYLFWYIARGFVMALISMLGIIVIIAAWYAIDFNGLWTAFHKLAFTNDLWLMMPDDALIIFYSLDFFTGIVRRIIEQVAFAYGILFVGGLVGWIVLPREKGRRFGKKDISD